MKSKSIFDIIAERFHYIVIIAFTACFNIMAFSAASQILAVFCAVYIAAYEIYLLSKRRDIKKLSETVVSMLNMTSQKRLIDFPIPVMVSASDGQILWYSEKFISETGEDSLRNLKNVRQFNSEILSSRVTKVSFSDKYFNVYLDLCVLNDREMYVLYFIDVTDYQNLLKKYNMQKPIVSHILVDNYDELFQNSKDSEKTSAMAVIENKLTEWAQSVGGLMRKTEKDRYLFIFKNEDLTKFIEKRFSILDEIRALNISSSAYPTISVGIGLGNSNFADNEEFSRIALDMALSRGGDQAVIKTVNGFEFFGGRTKGVEKRTKVKSRVVAASMKEILKSVDNVLVMGHQFADFDSLGACVGIARIALEAKKNVGIIYDNNSSLAQNLYEKLEQSQIGGLVVDAERALIMAGPKCLVVVVDTHRASYSMMPKILDYAGKIMVIDHHRKSADFIENAAIFFHEPYASSSCEMVTELMQYMNVNKMPSAEADAVMSGIYLDTKNFMVKTSMHTFEACSFLRKMGANTINVKKLFQTDMNTYMSRAEMVKSAQIYRKLVAIAAWTGEVDNNFRIVAAQTADELLNIEGVQASFTLFREKNGNVNISGRSYGGINVQLILEQLQGGGHQTMAGAQISGSSVMKAREALIKSIDRYLDESRISE